MARIAYLSMDSLDAFECYDHLTIPYVEARGHAVEEVSWRRAVAWDRYDYVIVRSPWDYQDDPEAFMAVLETIDRSPATLLNPLPDRALDSSVEQAISGNADDTFRIPRSSAAAFVDAHGGRFAARDCLLQPFLTAILGEGEFSLFYFAGAFSHCILKTPAERDFRVQEEHGGRLRLVTSPEEALLAAGRGVLDALGEPLLYARLDFVRDGEGFLLMEAELIEPSLYFNMDPASPERFAEALHRWIGAA